MPLDNNNGQICYQAYCESVKTTFDNRPLPSWEELGERQRIGWNAVYSKLIQKE